MGDTLDPVYEAAGHEWDVDPNLLRAIAAQETGGARNPDREVSGKGAIGRMQLMPDTARGLGVADPTDPVQSIWGGAKYMAQALDAERSPEAALAYYHGGPGWRDKWGPESAAYAPGVTAHYQRIAAAQPAAAAGPAGAQPGDPGSPPGAQPPVAALPSGGPARASAARENSPPSSNRTAGAAAAAADPFAASLSEPAAAAAAPADAFAASLGPPEQASRSSTEVGANAESGLPPALEARIAEVSGDTPQNRLLDAGLRGVREGFGSSPLGLDAAGTGLLQRMGVLPTPGGGSTLLQDVNQEVVPGLAAAGDLAYRTGGALLRGAQGLVTQGGVELARTPIGNYLDTAGLARDVAALPEAFPTGKLPNGAAMPNPLAAAGAVDRAITSRFAGPAAAAENPLTAGRPGEPPAAAGPAGPAGPTPGMGGPGAPAAAPGPNAAGAQANPGGAAAMTPAEVLANRATANRVKLLEPQPQGQDLTKYVEGVNPSTAETEQTVNAAREAKALGTKEPEISQMDRDLADANNEVRTQAFARLAESPTIHQANEAVRKAVADQDLQAAFGSKQPADFQGAADTVKSILADPRNSQNSAINKHVAPLLKRIEKLGAEDSPHGTIMGDPEAAYGLREDINRMQDDISVKQKPDLAYVTGQLQQVAQALDTGIEAGAPGYRQYLANFHAASIPIDEMKVLYKHEPELVDSRGVMQFSRMQNLMRKITKAQEAPGLNPYKSISDDTMGKLWALRDDLRRTATAADLAKAKGSDTTPLVMDLLKHAATSEAGTAAAGIVGSIAGGPVGAVTGAIGKRMLGNILSERTRQKDLKRGSEIFQPDPNRLRDPNAPP